jgi:para-aminobenzoate synthetase component I
LFKTYYDLNPAPFYAYINAKDHQVISTSPERFILRNQDRIETRPIKGTRPRGKTPEEDERLQKELFNSRKDDAELSMIVDLLRNDIGKVCVGGSVRVKEHKRLEAYRNVYHLVSVVEGELDEKYDSVDVVRATFPGGSITGCPKIRSMEIIDEMEMHTRHIYTGSIGYISFHGTMDLSIAIRTATVHNGKMTFSVGGGIVYDSDPEDEFDETLHKGQTLMSVFGGKNSSPEQPEKAWINGAVVPLAQAVIPVSHPGFQYGFGFFETIRAVNGKPKNLANHLERFDTTWKHLFSDTPPDLTWDEIIREVLIQNRLEDTVAAVKVMAAKGTREKPPLDNTLIVTARPYTHRLEGKKEPGINLVTYPHPRQTPLAGHKTLNYLFYYLAGKWATEQGGDEALVLNPDGILSETNTASLILVKGKAVIRPESPHVLPGTMEKKVCDILSEMGYAITTQPVFPKDLFSFDTVLMTNALIGAVPVLSLDGKGFSPPATLWRDISLRVL